VDQSQSRVVGTAVVVGRAVVPAVRCSVWVGGWVGVGVGVGVCVCVVCVWGGGGHVPACSYVRSVCATA
jgi:hypothetical protein